MSNEVLKNETLETVINYLPKLVNSIDIIFNSLQSGDERTSLAIFTDLMDGMQWVTQALKLTADIQVNPIDIIEINDLLRNVEDSLSSKDYILMCDILLYELKPILEKWERQLNQ